VQGLSYKFPLPPGDDLEAQTYSALYVRRRDLEAPGAEIFPPAVVDALCAAPAEPDVYDRRTGSQLTDLHRLPDPWDLPVIFAVRLSMSLPALLEAVRVYRISRRSSIVRDEFGRPISRGPAGRLKYPAETGKTWAEELWFSDGGITSNFPIHLFDSLFPLWPTVGITLSRHQPGVRHQDVWLPQDWQGRQVIGAPVSGGMAGFAGAIVDAARGWRDTAQSQMPAFVGRIATVRQRKDEGGTNLFMKKETIAALALRGELAGVRLRRRFRSPWWRRNQWLRFRSAMGNLEELREAMLLNVKGDAYFGLASATGSGALAALEASLVQGDPDMPRPLDWWQPSAAAYWDSAQQLTVAISAIPAADALNDGLPQPEPQLRQVPPA
jgi:predicted acylesterase/phospholipase RssA